MNEKKTKSHHFLFNFVAWQIATMFYKQSNAFLFFSLSRSFLYIHCLHNIECILRLFGAFKIAECTIFAPSKMSDCSENKTLSSTNSIVIGQLPGFLMSKSLKRQLP